MENSESEGFYFGVAIIKAHGIRAYWSGTFDLTGKCWYCITSFNEPEITKALQLLQFGPDKCFKYFSGLKICSREFLKSFSFRVMITGISI